jgi:hypothetical protein
MPTWGIKQKIKKYKKTKEERRNDEATKATNRKTGNIILTSSEIQPNCKFNLKRLSPFLLCCALPLYF